MQGTPFMDNKYPARYLYLEQKDNGYCIRHTNKPTMLYDKHVKIFVHQPSDNMERKKSYLDNCIFTEEEGFKLKQSLYY